MKGVADLGFNQADACFGRVDAAERGGRKSRQQKYILQRMRDSYRKMSRREESEKEREGWGWLC